MPTFEKIAEGTSSTAYLYRKNNKKYVKCVPTYKDNLSQWARHGRRYATVTQSISRKLNVDCAVAHLIRCNNSWELHMNFIDGEPLTVEKFESFPQDLKEKIAKDLAEFYLSCHELNIGYKDEKYASEISGKNDKFRLYIDILKHRFLKYKKSYFSVKRISDKRKILKNIGKIKKEINTNAFTPEEKDKIITCLTKIASHPDAFKFYGSYHADIHSKNIFFNAQKEKIGIIDFGGSTYQNNIYVELGYNAIPERMGFLFTCLLVEKINELSEVPSYNWKKHLYIDMDLLKAFMLYSAIKVKQSSEQKLKEVLKFV